MKRLSVLILGLALISQLHGFTVGAGFAGYDLIESGRSFSLVADASLPIIPTIFWRAGLFNLNLHFEPRATYVNLGTGLSSDLLFFVPLDMPVTPYLVAGIRAGYFSYDNAGANVSGANFNFKIGLGGQTDVGPVFGYLELGTDFSLASSGGSSSTDFPVFFQLGIRKPLKFKIKR